MTGSCLVEVRRGHVTRQVKCEKCTLQIGYNRTYFANEMHEGSHMSTHLQHVTHSATSRYHRPPRLPYIELPPDVFSLLID